MVNLSDIRMITPIFNLDSLRDEAQDYFNSEPGLAGTDNGFPPENFPGFNDTFDAFYKTLRGLYKLTS